MSSSPAAAGPPPASGNSRRAGAGDMARSLAFIVIPLLVITIFFTRSLGDAPVRPVDWQPVREQAQASVDWPVLAPENLPPDWVPLRVRWLAEGDPGVNEVPSPRNHWRLGYLGPDEIYIELNQGDKLGEELVAESTREGLPDGSSTVDRRTWQRVVSGDDRTRGIVLRDREVTTVVAGDTGYEQLEAYAATLRS